MDVKRLLANANYTQYLTQKQLYYETQTFFGDLETNMITSIYTFSYISLETICILVVEGVLKNCPMLWTDRLREWCTGEGESKTEKFCKIYMAHL